MENFRILFVDDDRDILELVEKYLSRHGYDIQVVDNALEALDRILDGRFDLVFTDYKMPEVDGLELLARIKDQKPETVVVIVTGHGTMDSAIQAMRHGSYDYIQKPFRLEALRLLIDSVQQRQQLEREGVVLRSRVTQRFCYQGLVGMNPRMRRIYDIIHRIRGHSPDVLIEGETGTGKELTARVIHDTGSGSERPWVRVNCAVFQDEPPTASGLDRLSELAASAAGGTLYLDEITDMSPGFQRFILQTLGSARDVRIVAATHLTWTIPNPDPAAREGILKDLLERLRPVTLRLPPLRERKEDICLLTVHFLDRHNRKAVKKIAGITEDAMNAMLAYDWPGNVIELKNMVERAAAMGVETVIGLADLPAQVRLMARLAPCL